jgi:branched-chain amino acid transport system permease protein
MVASLIIALAVLAMALTGGHLVVNAAGHMTLALAAWWATAAYAYAAAAASGLPVAAAMLVAIGASILVGAAHCLLALRLARFSYALGTLALQQTILAILAGGSWFGGRQGITSVERLAPERLLPLAIVLLVAAPLVVFVLKRSALGRRLAAIRQDVLAAESVGIRPAIAWAALYLLASILIGLGGVVYCLHIGSVMYGDFGVHMSVLMLLAVILGRYARAGAPLVGAGFIVLLPELLRFVPFGGGHPEFFRNVLFAGLAVVVLWATGSTDRVGTSRSKTVQSPPEESAP